MPRGRGGYRPQCTYPGCAKPNAAKGLCRSHYQRWRKTGDPERTPSGRREEVGVDVLDKATRKFLRGIRKLENGCWTCDTAQLTKRGYLHLTIAEKHVRHIFRAHRFSYEHFKGPLPKGMHACHKCDESSCCNPDHLFPGTPADNMQDMVRKGRGLVGEKNANTRFTEADVFSIYRDVDAGLSREAIAKKHNVSAVTISHIATGRNWKHLFQRHRLSEPM